MLSVYKITDSGVDTVVIPLGSVEGKGPHLPLGSDLILAEAFTPIDKVIYRISGKELRLNNGQGIVGAFN